MKIFEYSILQYSPSIIANEKINLGVLINCLDDNEAEFVHIEGKHFKRLKSFDDELNINVVKMLLQLIEDDIESFFNPILSNAPIFNLSQYIRGFSNEYKFTMPISIKYANMEQAKKEITNVCLRLYLPKTQRKDKKEEFTFLKRIFETNELEYSNKRSDTFILDKYSLTTSYDYICNHDIGIKLLYLNSQTLGKSINNIKAWLWNCNNTNLKNIILIYVVENQNTTEVQNVINMLKQNHNEVYDIKEDLNDLIKVLKK